MSIRAVPVLRTPWALPNQVHVGRALRPMCDSVSAVRADAAVVATTLQHIAAIRDVTRRFDGYGIPAIVLKGPSFDRWLYGRQEYRSYVDGDLLVPKDMLLSAGTALEAMGYVRLGSWREGLTTHAVSFRHRTTGASIDLHHTLGLVDVGVEAWAVLSRRTENIELRGTPVTVLDEAARCLHVALHAIQSYPDRSARALVDLQRAIGTASSESWRSASELARELRCLPWFCAGISLDDHGAALLDELGLEFDPALVEARERGSGMEFALLRSATMTHWRDRIGHLWVAGTPSPEAIRRRYALMDVSPWMIVVGYSRWGGEMIGTIPRALRWVRERARQPSIRHRWPAPRTRDGLWKLVALFVSLIARAALRLLGYRRTLNVAGRLPAVFTTAPDVVEEEWFRWAGQCLGKSIAQLAFLRICGSDDDVMIGVSTDPEFAAHAWLRSQGPAAGFVVLDDKTSGAGRSRLLNTVGVACLDTRTVLLTPRGRYLVLNGSARLLLEPLIRGDSHHQLCELLRGHYSVDRVTASRDVQAVERALIDAGVLEPRGS